MEKLLNLQETISGKKFEIANDKIKQTDRNALKKEFLDSLKDSLDSQGFDVERTDDGVVLVLQAENTPIYIAIDGVVKNLDYDLDLEIAEYETKLEKQAERERERIAKREKNSK